MWFNDPAQAPAATPKQATWADVFAQWSALELDLHQRFGVDAEDRPLLESRTWRWLHLRITDLVSDPSSRVGQALTRTPSK